MFSTFRPSKPSKQEKSNSLCNGKTQLSSGLLEQSGTGKAPSERSFVKSSRKLVNDETFSPCRRDEMTDSSLSGATHQTNQRTPATKAATSLC